ncbi:MAG: tetrahydromethanopterin S-methyltransferase subunit H [Candidatus Freyarchaeota archaeon]|nr:tetrahydromethanopterin S-methyltransferase subunit H [Candidatus Jordarchaeia archaeon]
MLHFKTEQKVFEVAGVRFGGQPGENPIILVGSMCYNRHKIVKDERKGVFEREEAERLVKEMEEFSDRTGLPGLVDVVASTEEAAGRYIEFAADATDRPFLLDSPTPEVKLYALRFAKDIGAEKRMIYNSLSAESKDQEFAALKESGVEAAIILAYTRNVTSSRARVEVVEKLLPRAGDAGVTKPLIDTFVMDVPSLTPAAVAAVEVKRRYGLPCGSGAHNAVATWSGLKSRLGKEAMKSTTVAANVIQLILGSNFVLYGPIEDCKHVFPAVHTIATSFRHAYRMKEYIEL